MSPYIQQRAAVLASMDHVIRTANHEDAYETWILVVPDQADDDDFVSIAEDDEEFEYACKTFVRLIELFGKYGW